ncbi:hypothetical protein Z965_01330 [Clostridium novyi A str. BKT29909]|uniref:DUF6263 family protein n=1 Tax=Clostridium TaxID=1485 RepID=UPI0004D73CCB|nr:MULTISPECIES: DUF6263 family protein [Clostridium]KEH90271.1 hypothetical protein Z965_01330 [Clostridium novyi A str. BKT29909]KEH94080.1 hypothetical protein Z963_11415 [Clostridium botulinum C/D str. It1]
MKKKLIFLILMVYLCSILSGCVKMSKKMTLELKKGEAFRMQIDGDKSFKGPSSESIELKSREAFLCSVNDVNNAKDMEMKVTIDSIDIDADIKGKDYLKKYLSDIGIFLEGDKSIYSKFLGKSFKVKLTENGKVEKVMGIDDIGNAVLKEEQDPKKKELIKNFIKKELSEEVLEEKIQRIIGFYSDKKVDIGDKWEKTNKVLANLPVDVDEKYTLKERKEGTTDIIVNGEIKKRESAQPVKADDVEISYEDIKGKEKGTITIGQENKMIKTEELDSEYEGKIKIMFKDPSKGAEYVPVSAKEKITVNVLKQ